MRDSLGREEIISPDKARNILSDKFTLALPSETVLAIEDSYRRILSRDVFSSEDLPPFSRSTVDGFAVISSDTFGASDGTPAYLNVIGEIPMAKAPSLKIKKGEAARISTGGMFPEGADAIVMLEHIHQIDGNIIETSKPVTPGENIIQIGEDVKKGELVLKKGHRLRPQDIGALAGLGIIEICVYEKPKISIISTGDEVIAPDANASAGCIRDINSLNLAALTFDAGGEPVKHGIFPDEYSAVKKIVEYSLVHSDMVLITGGSSVGARDLTAKVINDIGKPGVLFHGVSMKPGKPVIGGLINNKPVFGLPGHPAAVTVCFEQFIEPLLTRLTGFIGSKFTGKKPIVKAKMLKNVASVAGREDHIRVQLDEKEGEVFANPILGKSGLITTLVKADGIVVIPMAKLGLEKGEEVEAKLFV
jgi:molybdopterin molybdotransferase